VSRAASVASIPCPALGRASSFGLLLGALWGCSYIPRPVEGVPVEAPWAALPLRGWLAEDRIEPEAMAMCGPPECRPGLLVAVLKLAGREADEAEAVLRRPERLAHALMAAGEKPRAVASYAEVSALAEDASRGFFLTLGRKDGTKRPAFGAALGQRAGSDLRLVVVIGEEPDAVEAAARRVARRHLGP
jgi:hypothetical protein